MHFLYKLICMQRIFIQHHKYLTTNNSLKTLFQFSFLILHKHSSIFKVHNSIDNQCLLAQHNLMALDPQKTFEPCHGWIPLKRYRCWRQFQGRTLLLFSVPCLEPDVQAESSIWTVGALKQNLGSANFPCLEQRKYTLGLRKMRQLRDESWSYQPCLRWSSGPPLDRRSRSREATSPEHVFLFRCCMKKTPLMEATVKDVIRWHRSLRPPTQKCGFSSQLRFS